MRGAGTGSGDLRTVAAHGQPMDKREAQPIDNREAFRTDH
jgi:hypothetical protein